MVKIQAKKVVERLTERSPNTHVPPSKGRRTMVATNSCLQEVGREREGGRERGREGGQKEREHNYLGNMA